MRRTADDLVVVTSPDDRRTRELCKARGIRAVVTTAMYDHGRKFSLGAAIDAGLRDLQLDEWVLVVDADIVLPAWTRSTLERLELDGRKLYGIDRVHCRGWHAWRRFCTTPRAVMQWEVPFLRDFPVNARMQYPSTRDVAGYFPCGYFQLWHPWVSEVENYPANAAGTAEGSDLEHALRWPRRLRELIPDLVAIQLETDQPEDPVGANWAGRKTPEFSAEGGTYRK